MKIRTFYESFINKQREQLIVFCSFVLCLLSFLVEVNVPWAVAAVGYLFVVVFSSLSKIKKLPILVAFLSTILMALSLTIQFPEGLFWRVITNHMLVLLTIWGSALTISIYQKQQSISAILSTVFHDSNDAIWLLDLNGVIVEWNRTAEIMFGYKSDEIVGKSNLCLMPDEYQYMLGEILEKIKSKEKIHCYEAKRKRKDGTLLDVSINVSPISDHRGILIGASVIARNISERKVAERQKEEFLNRLTLEKNKLQEVLGFEEGLHSIFNTNALIDYIVKKTVNILNAEKCSLMLFDQDTEELCIKGHQGLDEKLVLNHRVKLGQPIAGQVALGNKSKLIVNIEKENEFLRVNRDSYSSKSFISAPIKLGNRLLGVLNVTDKKTDEEDVFNQIDLKVVDMIVAQVAVALEASQMYKQLKYLTVTDSLTGIHNFRYLTKSLESEISRAKRYKRPLCLLLIDIDNFKQYNDTLGHLDGDELLKQVSNIFQQSVREVDLVCRYAGDEFIIILPDTNLEGAKLVAEKIRNSVDSLILKVHITVSIGIAQYNERMDRYDFMRKSDSALYEAKHLGKNSVFVNV